MVLLAPGELAVLKPERYEDTWDWCGLLARDYVTARFPLTATVLDVGACWGKYRHLLPHYPAMDACEAWEPYVEAEDLRALYRHVFLADICELVTSPDWHGYDLVIMGDVLEHIRRDRAQAMLGTLLATCGDVIAAVPYEYEQGPEHGNHYQRHLQADLTPDLMAAEYPGLVLLDTEYRRGKPFKGLYARKDA